MLDTLQVYDRLKNVMDPKAARELAEVIGAVAEDRRQWVTKVEFNELKEIVRELAQAQKRTEQRVEELAQAQKRTEERVEELAQAQHELAQAQRRTEERVEELAQAQKRTEERVEELAQAQKRTEERVEELAQAQRRTEQRVEELAQAQKRTEDALQSLARQVGGLSETIGGDIEDIAYIVLHRVLKQEFGWKVGELRRVWQTWDREPEEVNIFGQAFDPARPDATIWIVGEAKHNLTVKEANRFLKQLERARRNLAGEIFPVCFCYRARPEVEETVTGNGVNLVYSYGHLERARA